MSELSEGVAAVAEMPRGRRAATVFIFITVLLDIVALGIIIPILPKLVEDFVGGDMVRAAKIYGLFGSVWAVMQFVFSPVLGTLSDRFGRRPVILLSNFGLSLDYVLMALAPNLGWLFAGRVISGITAASFTTAGAYIADVTEPDKRAQAFGMLGAAFGVGFVLGPALGGLLGGIDPRLPFWCAAGLSLLNAVYGMFVLPESLPPALRSAFTWAKANPVASLSLFRRTKKLSGLAVVHFITSLAHAVLPSVFVLYAGYRYAWGEREVGLTLAGVGVFSLIVQGGLVGPVVKKLGERKTVALGLLTGALGFVFYGIAETGLVFLVGIPIMSLWGLGGPAAQGIMTREVGADEQGRLQGASTSLMGLAELFGPLIFSGVFAYFIAPDTKWHLPGAPFLLAACLLVIAALTALAVTKENPA